MKHLLQDSISGAYLKKCSKDQIVFTHDIHDAVLFPSKAKATKAFKKLITPSGSFKHPKWWMMQEDGTFPIGHFVSEAAKATGINGLQSWERTSLSLFKTQVVAPYALELRCLTYSLQPI
jgi:hypothetical protein